MRSHQGGIVDAVIAVIAVGDNLVIEEVEYFGKKLPILARRSRCGARAGGRHCRGFRSGKSCVREMAGGSARRAHEFKATGAGGDGCLAADVIAERLAGGDSSDGRFADRLFVARFGLFRWLPTCRHDSRSLDPFEFKEPRPHPSKCYEYPEDLTSVVRPENFSRELKQDLVQLIRPTVTG